MKQHALPLLATICICALSFTHTKRALNKKLDVVKVDGATYIDAREISVISWAEFMSWNMKAYGENSNEFKKTIPDLETKKYFSISSKGLMWTEPKYRNYPVTGISYEQVVAFCDWRSKKLSDAMGKKIICRLMTREEYNTYLSYFPSSALLSPEGEYEYATNTKMKKGIYNLSSYSEICKEKGVAVLHKNSSGKTIIQELSYDTPSDWMSFRCILQSEE